MKKIFLSYRRDDIPSYVARLEDALEQAFGENRVFRDVEDIAGGSAWKMPRKFEFTLDGVGRGQFSVSNTGDSMIGWIMKNGGRQQVFDTLTRVPSR